MAGETERQPRAAAGALREGVFEGRERSGKNIPHDRSTGRIFGYRGPQIPHGVFPGGIYMASLKTWEHRFNANVQFIDRNSASITS